MIANIEAGSLKRGVALLKILATAGSRGLPLTELAAVSGLPHPSAHRVLKQLQDERLVEHHPESRRYRLGLLTFELGLASSVIFDMRDLCEPAMQKIAESTGDTVYLVVRSGFDAVCAHRLEGYFPIRTFVLEVGSRRPLGVGAGGLAILAMVDETERAEVIGRIAPSLAQFGGLTAASVAQSCRKSRSYGAAVIHDKVNPGVTAVGRAFRGSIGQPVAALSVAAMSQRMTSTRTRQIASELELACDRLEERLRASNKRAL